MQAVTSHERPGVYSVYSVSAVVHAAGRSGNAGLVAKSAKGQPGEVYTLNSYQEAVSQFGSGDNLTALAKLLFANGAAKVVAAPVSSDYGVAFSALNREGNLRVVVCDSTEGAVQKALRDKVMVASQNQKERIAVVPGGAEENVASLVQRASTLASQRVVLTAPGGAAVAAAVAGAICAESDPAVPLGGAVLQGLEGWKDSYSEDEIDNLIRGGVTPVEAVGGVCSVVRGVTTRITTGGVSDLTWRDLTTILVVDHVVPAVRDSLRSRFTRMKNTPQVRSAIRSQVILELESKKGAEIITDYGEVTVQGLEEDPSVCVVGFSFTVSHGLNQIWLTAQITV